MPAARKITARLDAEIAKALERVKTSRTRRDLLERPTPGRVLRRIDLALQQAEDQVGHLANAETKATSPDAYRIGNEIYDDLETLRWKLHRYKLP